MLTIHLTGLSVQVTARDHDGRGNRTEGPNTVADRDFCEGAARALRERDERICLFVDFVANNALFAAKDAARDVASELHLDGRELELEVLARVITVLASELSAKADLGARSHHTSTRARAPMLAAHDALCTAASALTAPEAGERP